jgi:hypothetical protein
MRRSTALVLSLAALSGLTFALACGRKEAAAAPAPAPAAAPGGSQASKPAEAPGALVSEKALVDGHLTQVSHSTWDGGQTSDMFDTNTVTMARTANANPAIIELKLPEARPLRGLELVMGGAEFRLTAVLTPAGGGAPKTFSKDFRNTGADPKLDLEFDTGKQPIESVKIEILDLDSNDGHIHIRTLKLL